MAEVPTMNDPAWYDVIGRFKAKATEFVKAFDDLQAAYAKAPSGELKQKGAKLIERGNTIGREITRITQAIDTIGGWWSSTFGGFGNIPTQGPLGAIPLIPIAVVAASVAAMTYFVSDVYKYISVVNEARRLEAGGMSPEQAASAAQGYINSPLKDAKTIAVLIALGVAAFAIAPVIAPAIKRGMKR